MYGSKLFVLSLLLCKSKKNKLHSFLFIEQKTINLYQLQQHLTFMIKFKNLRTADKSLIQSYTLWGERQNCDLSFANLISWKFLYNTQYAIVNDYLVFRFYFGKQLAYMMPIPKPQKQNDGTFKVVPCEECSVETLNAIRQDAIAMGHPFMMKGVCHFMLDLIETYFPDEFDVEPNRDSADYIYTREKLINLSGKKLQSKRNHINKFKNLYPQYQYKPLTPDMIPQCLELERQWRKVSKDDTDQDEPNEELSVEMRSMTRAFNRWEELELTGGTIWVDKRLVAFTYGCPINQSTFDVCVEKADASYEGAFTIINQEFVKHLPEQYFYINREEDMGSEGLRRAKESYYPDILLEKNTLMEKNPPELFADHDRIKRETRALWELVFNDPQPFIDLYFNHVYTHEYNIVCQLDGKVVAALQTLPYTLLYHHTEIPICYVSGVSTHPDYREQGIGDNLMQQAHINMYYKDIVFATLIPAEEWLYNWYGKCGYAPRIVCKPPIEHAERMTFKEFDAIQRQKECIVLHDSKDWDIVQKDIQIAGTSSQPNNNPIQGMIRVINAHKALQHYAAAHPDLSIMIRVEDDMDIPANNAYYVLKDGQARQTDEPLHEALRMNIVELADFIFKDEDAEMSFMLN